VETPACSAQQSKPEPVCRGLRYAADLKGKKVIRFVVVYIDVNLVDTLVDVFQRIRRRFYPSE
jgi:hypothetical protein